MHPVLESPALVGSGASQAPDAFENAFQNAPIGMALVSTEGRWLKTNRAMRELVGYSENELVLKTFQEMTHPDDLQEALVMTFRLFSGIVPTAQTEGRYFHKSGRVVWVQVNESVVRDADGTPLYAIAQIQDITNRKMGEADLSDLVHEVERANRELNDFAHVVSHDLKAPLRGIFSLVQWMEQDYGDVLGEEGKAQLKLLSSRTRRMNDLIDGILRYSRIGRVCEVKEDVDINALFKGVVDLLAPPASVHVETKGPLPVLHGDPIRLQQVFQNLIGNAVKYLDKPEGRVLVSVEEEDAFWRFCVADNGPGIEARHFERIFKIFQTLVPKDRRESTGVGLAIVRKVVQGAGGRVWVESDPGQGARFYFTWPQKENS